VGETGLPILEVPANLAAYLSVAAFGIAILAALLTPVLARLDQLAPWKGPLRLVPYALLLAGAGLAIASAVLGVAGGHRPGVREVVAVALALLCITPVVGVAFVRLRYGSPGRRTFYQQIAANQGSSILLVLVLFEIVAVTAFLIGAAVGVAFESALVVGLLVAGVSLAVTAGATWFAVFHGGGFVLDSQKAKEAAGGPRETQLRNIVREMAIAANVPEPTVYVIDTPGANALSVGRDPQHASIAVTRGLLEQLDREELQGVVAHELAHVANFDSRHAVLVAFLVGAVVILTDIFFALVLELAKHPPTDFDDIRGLAAGLAMWGAVVVVGLVVGGLLKLCAPFAALAVQAAISRDREYLADATAVRITRNPQGLIEALTKLEATRPEMAGANRGTQHLWIVNPVKAGHEGGRGWFDTHPATADRVARLRELAGLGDTTASPEAVEGR
jgi:heat shock protein HtpX